MTLETDSLKLLTDALATLETRFDRLPAYDPAADLDAMRDILQEVAERMTDNYPYPHPFYAGQMLKPPHPMARVAYMLALWINPNNHALDGGRASSFMEKEAVAEIAAMFGWQTYLGHLTSGGTIANMEALWIAGRTQGEGQKIVASEQAHYTHSRLTNVLKIPYQSIATDSRARMDVAALEQALQQGDIGTVVVTLGTSAAGAVDPLPAILALRQTYAFRIHVDCAYGGYFTLADNLSADVRAAFDQIHAVDSIAIDPHKQGLQPYGCGCILFKDPAVGQFYQHDSPYTYFTSDDLHLGEISLECSRAGASAIALWATQRLLPLEKDGTFAQDLSKERNAALTLIEHITNDDRFRVLFNPDLDIVIWVPVAESASRISTLSQQLFDRAAAYDVHLAVSGFPKSIVQAHLPDIDWDQATVLCLRSCLMKPEHDIWVDRLWATFQQAADDVLAPTPNAQSE